MPAVEIRDRADYRRCLIAIGLVVALDSALKALVRQVSGVRRLPFVVPVQNHGYFLEIGSGIAPALTSAVFLTAMGGWLAWALRAGRVRPVAAALVFGGAASNVLERITRGAVTDFIPAGWIVVDLADLAVICGLLMIVTSRLRRSRLSRRQ